MSLIRGGGCLFLFPLLLAAIVLTSAAPASAFLGFGKYTTIEAQDGAVRIPLADVSDSDAHYYQYKKDGTGINFFVLKSSDGVIRAAFDACDVCFHEKKGYSPQGEFMVCNNCGMRFHSSRINEVQGGCNPAPLSRTVDGDDLVIQVADILPGARFF